MTEFWILHSCLYLSFDDCYLFPIWRFCRLYYIHTRIFFLFILVVCPSNSRSAFWVSRPLSYCFHAWQNRKKSKGGRYSCFETPFDEGKSAFCSTLYISKQRKFVPLFDSGGTFLICACVKEISPETLRSVVFWSKTPC